MNAMSTSACRHWLVVRFFSLSLALFQESLCTRLNQAILLIIRLFLLCSPPSLACILLITDGWLEGGDGRRPHDSWCYTEDKSIVDLTAIKRGVVVQKHRLWNAIALCDGVASVLTSSSVDELTVTAVSTETQLLWEWK